MPFIHDWPEDAVYAIHDAELLVTTVDKSVSSQYTYPSLPLLKLRGINEDGEDIIMEDFFDGQSYRAISYDIVEYTYSFNITYYMERLINKNKDNYGLFLAPYGSNSSPQRSLVGSGINDAYTMKLILTYSKP